MERFKKQAVAGLLLIAVMISLGACANQPAANNLPENSGGGAQQEENGPIGGEGEESEPQNEVVNEPATRMVQQARGEVEVPAAPQKIAVINVVAFEDNLLALGVKPYIAPSFAWSEAGFLPYLAEELAGAEQIDGAEPNLEQLLALGPDLIIIEERHEKAYEHFAQIAPTVVVTSDTDWRARLWHLAEIVNKVDEAEKLLQQYDDQVARVREQIRAAIGSATVVLANLRDKQMIRVQGTTLHAVNELLYQELGLLPAAGVPTDEGRVETSFEGFVSMQPDHIFLQNDREKSAAELLAVVEGDKVLATMDAVSAGRVYVLDEPLTMSWGVLGRQLLMEQMRASLAE